MKICWLQSATTSKGFKIILILKLNGLASEFYCIGTVLEWFFVFKNNQNNRGFIFITELSWNLCGVHVIKY